MRVPGITVTIPITNLVSYLPQLDPCLMSIRNQTLNKNMIDIILSCVLGPSDRQYSGIDLGNFTDLAKDYNATIVFAEHCHSEFPPALARNVGGRRGVRKYMTFVDADAVLHPEVLGESVWKLKNTDVDVVETKTSMTPWEPGEDVYYRCAERGAGGCTKVDFFTHCAKQGRLAPGTGCCTVISQDLYERLGGLNEEIIGYGATDWEFTERLKKAGCKFVNLTDRNYIVNLHQNHPRPFQDLPAEKVPSRHRNRTILEATKANPDPVRNRNGWGGMPA